MVGWRGAARGLAPIHRSAATLAFKSPLTTIIQGIREIRHYHPVTVMCASSSSFILLYCCARAIASCQRSTRERTRVVIVAV